jgi:hypothetical protein
MDVEMNKRTDAQGPMQGLLARLPLLPLTAAQEVDFQAADPALLVSLADDAETTMNIINLGVGAIGHLLAHSAVVIEDGTIGADSVESLGFLLSEISSMSFACLLLASRCRRETADYRPE